MPVLSVEVSEDIASQLAELAEVCTEADRERNGATTHGAMTAATLLAMLAEDAAMIVTRPGSWEGNGMAAILTAHGYEF